MKPCSNLCPQGDCAGCTGVRLFPRISPTPYGAQSRKAQAHCTLDRLKEGDHISPSEVDAALRETGDLTDQPARAHLGVAA